MSHPVVLRSPALVLAAALAVLAAGLVATTPARAATSDLIISEYVEGSGSNKAIEIFNGTGAPVSLADYRLELYSNGSAGVSNFYTSTATLADNDVYVVANPSAGPALLALADDTNGGTVNWNGDDAVVLRKGGAGGPVVDSLGVVGTDPGSQWGSAPTSTLNQTLRRQPSVLSGDTNTTDAFDPATQWEGFATDDFSGLGSHTVNGGADSGPTVTETAPADGATDVPLAGNVEITFSEPVDTATGWFAIECTTSGTHTATVSEGSGGAVRTLDPDDDLALDETCTVEVTAADVTDRDTVDPPDAMGSDVSFSFATITEDPCETAVTAIHDLQGAGSTSPVSTQTHSTEGVVTGDFQGDAGMRGFFIQDATPDADPLTSEGIFVFVPPASPFFSLDLQAGDSVHLRGRVTEFQNQTEIDNVDQLVVCGTGPSIDATSVSLPETTNGDLERFEGMKVELTQTLTVEQNFFQGRYGQLTLGAGGRLYQATNQFPAGTPEAQALADRNRRSLIVLDDATTAQNPDPVPYLPANGIRRAGDTVSDISGILDEGPINSDTTIRDYRVQPTSAPTFSQDNARTTAPAAVGGNLKVAFFNVLNYFTTLTSENSNARGADSAAEFQRQRTKIFAAMSAIDADVFGLSEIENLPGSDAVQDLVDGLNDYVDDPGRYAAVADPATGTGSDAIKVALIFKPATVATVGDALSDPAAINNRPPIAQTFRLLANGETASVVVNHFKSKGSCPTATDPDAAGNTDSGDGQGCWNARRVEQAQQLLTFIDVVKTTSGDDDVLAIGDFNSYGHEDPIEALTAAGLHNEISRFVGDRAYSYVFDGLSGYLDHGLATASADAQVVGATEWHINADEPSVIDYNTEFKPDDRYAPTPYRSSDHDPVVLGVDLGRCQFSDDARHHIRTLQGDCSTSTTTTVPNGWTLDGDGHTITAYDAAGEHFRGAVVANAGKVANVYDLTVDAHELADVCDAGVDALRGILLDGASGVLDSNQVIDVRQNGSGCQEGNAIEVRNAPFSKGGRDVYVAVTRNEVRGYQKTGILVSGSVRSLVYGNTVQGLGQVPYIAQNGVQVSLAGSGIVSNNQITDNYYTGTADAQACGVLFFQDDRATQLGNRFAGNQVDVCKVR